MKIKKIIRFLPPLIWMTLIFWASSQHKVGMGGNYWISFAIFKTIHVIEYGILYTLWRLALLKQNYADSMAIFISLAYGISDEFHQTLVPTREGTVRDVIIDFVGILIFAELFNKIILSKVKKIKIIQSIYKIPS